MRFQFRVFSLLMMVVLICSVCYGQEDLNAVQEKSLSKAAQEPAEEKLKISREQALVIAEQLDVVKALYGLRGGEFQNCIEKSVVKPCDSEWVTCVEDAWVVKFVVGSLCQIQHDGRLNINILVDGNTGEVKSQYPEADYFKDKNFCRDKTDCIQVDIKGKNNQVLDKQCYNFIYAQSQFYHIPGSDFKNMTPSAQAITQELQERSQNCICQQSLCANKLVE